MPRLTPMLVAATLLALSAGAAGASELQARRSCGKAPSMPSLGEQLTAVEREMVRDYVSGTESYLTCLDQLVDSGKVSWPVSGHVEAARDQAYLRMTWLVRRYNGQVRAAGAGVHPASSQAAEAQ